MVTLLYGFIYLYVFIFGAILGSFLNVVIYRIPQGNFLEESRSYCPHCHTPIKAYDLIPILSFIILRGKCRECKEKISWRYPLIEAFTGIMAVASVLRFGFTLETVLVFGVMAILIAVTMIDFDTMEIPNGLIIALIPFAIGAVFLFKDVTILSRIIGFFMISAPMLILTLVIPGAFGGGDIKLIAVCGFLLGFPNTLLAFFISLLFGGGYAIFLMLTHKVKPGVHIAFGPYLCIGIVVAMFYGNEIVGWYLNFFNF